MSGIAELLANLGYVVSGSDQKRSDHTDRLASLGVSVQIGHAAANVAGRRRGRGVVGGPRRQPRGRRGAGPGHSGGAAGRNAGRADASPLRHRRRRRARQDLDDLDDRAGPRAGRARPHRGHRRPAARLRQQRPARQGRAHGRRGRRERPLVPQAVAGDRRDHQHRPRAHGGLRRVRGPAAGVRGVRQQGAVLRRGRRLRRRSRAGPAAAAHHPAGHHLRRGRRHRRDRRGRRAAGRIRQHQHGDAPHVGGRAPAARARPRRSGRCACRCPAVIRC